VSGLTVGAFYHFRVVATNSAGTVTGADQMFQAGPGVWTPAYRCPVDDPAMLATNGINTLPLCLASNSPHGSITIGNTTTLTGNSNLQIGITVDVNAQIFTAIPPPSGALISDPVQVVAGGLLATATVENAGTPSNLNILGGISLGVPIVTLPIKIHLEGTALGPNCFIGSDMNPILLNPQNTDLSGASFAGVTFDPDGTPDPNGSLLAIVITGAVQGDDTFAVPAAQGCGPGGDGSFDSLINSVVGLPSPSGANHIVLSDASSFVADFNGDKSGPVFAADWHTAFGP
jgi:hypothetical protein